MSGYPVASAGGRLALTSCVLLRISRPIKQGSMAGGLLAHPGPIRSDSAPSQLSNLWVARLTPSRPPSHQGRLLAVPPCPPQNLMLVNGALKGITHTQESFAACFGWVTTQVYAARRRQV